MFSFGSSVLRRSPALSRASKTATGRARNYHHSQRLSSDASKTSEALVESQSSTSKLDNINLLTSGRLQRHGNGDAVITLNVGGKEFSTLRSTVATNPVLAQYVARAEANKEFTHGGTAIFIDRDPTHFQLILNHLRNKVEGLSYYAKSSKSKNLFHSGKSKEYRVQLPKDLRALRDIYVEASHYQIQELQAASCEQNVIVTIIGATGGGGNPFDRAQQAVQFVRRGFVALGGMGTLAMGAQQDHGKFLSTIFPVWFPEEKGGEDKKDDGKKELQLPA